MSWLFYPPAWPQQRLRRIPVRTLPLRDVVLVGGAEVSVLDDPPLRIEDTVEGRSTASFAVRDLTGGLRFGRGVPVQFYDDEGEVAFGGVTDAIVERRVNADGVLVHTISCIDNHYFADKRLVTKIYEDMPVEEIVEDLVTSYLEEEGIPLASAQIDSGLTIGETIINYVSVSKALQALAELAGFWWRIDHQKRLRFKARGTETAPWSLTSPLTGLTAVRGTVQFTRSNPWYRNRQFERGGRDLSDPQEETAVGDGESRAFPVGLPIAKVPTVEVSTDGGLNWTPQTVGIKGLDTGKDFYWSKGDPIVAQDAAATPLASGHLIRITYQGEFDIVVVSENSSEILARQAIEGGSGKVEVVDDDSSITSRTAGLEKAAGQLAKYGVEGGVLRYVTRRSGLAPGQVQTVTLPEHDLAGAELLIERITVERHREDGGYRYWRTVEAVEGPTRGGWERILARHIPSFVDRLSVGTASVLALQQAFNEALPLAETVTMTVSTCDFPAEDLYPSTTRYPC